MRSALGEKYYDKCFVLSHQGMDDPDEKSVIDFVPVDKKNKRKADRSVSLVSVAESYTMCFCFT